jgi:hypothetical protein
VKTSARAEIRAVSQRKGLILAVNIDRATYLLGFAKPNVGKTEYKMFAKQNIRAV